MQTSLPTIIEPFKLLLRPREAAAALGISERMLWTLAERGEIPRVKIGRAVRYSIESLRAYIALREKAVRRAR